MSTKTETNELVSVARMLRDKYPDHSADDIASLVREVYTRLSSEATVTAHLIPLTVNRCQRTLTMTRQRNQSAVDSVTSASRYR